MSSAKDMKSDTKRSLLDIHDGSASTLVAHLLQVQNHAQSREETKKQASKLRFLDISSAFQDGERKMQNGSHVAASPASPKQNPIDLPVRTLDLTRREKVTGHPYMAVSWRWKSADEGQRPHSSFQYRIRTPEGALRSSGFPDFFFDRVINVAKARGIRYIWNDKDCIVQHNTLEKNKDIQAMERVYRNSKLAVGLIRERIQTKRELESLTDLISRSCFRRNSENDPRFNQDISEERISSIFRVLRKILHDKRWKRAWIFQEDLCASDRMLYLIPCDPSLPKDGRFDYGSVPGELQVPSKRFRQTATRFLLALDAAKRSYPREMLHKVMQYNIWDRIDSSTTTGTSATFTNTTVSILSNLERKGCEYHDDRIAILANCCNYPIGLDIEPLKVGKFSLSTAIMALYFLNGEIFKSGPHYDATTAAGRTKTLLAKPVQKCLRASSLPLEIPGPAYNHSFMTHCRFPEVVLTDYGIETSGWVFALRGILKFSSEDRKRIARKERQLLKGERKKTNLRKTQQSVLWLLIYKLNGRGFDKLAGFLVEHMRRDKQGLNTAATSFINRMVEAVLDAYREPSRPLLLGYLDGQTQPSGMLVSPASCPQDDRPRMVFTSWSKNGSREPKNFASVQVESECDAMGITKLSCVSWINGVWDVSGYRKSACTFKWPFEV